VVATLNGETFTRAVTGLNTDVIAQICMTSTEKMTLEILNEEREGLARIVNVFDQLTPISSQNVY